nr:unnamed protein product [Spirometra erinaceieuropaei]
MVPFDGVLLFISILPDLAHGVLHKRLEENYDETNGSLKIDHLLLLFAFCQQTFFTFNDRTYEQIKGTPMDSPISSLVAELVLQELEKVTFDHYEPAFWRRYVDNTFVIIKRSRLADLQDLLNDIFPDIQFTREEEHAEQLPFLDVLVTRTPNGELSTTVYRNATNTTPILNYHRQSGRQLSSRITKHKRTVRRGDQLSQVATHTLEEGHEFDFASTRIVARGSNKTGRELLEAWASDADSINRQVDTPPLLSRALFPRPRGRTQFPAKGARSHAAVRRRGLSLIANTTPSRSAIV